MKATNPLFVALMCCVGLSAPAAAQMFGRDVTAVFDGADANHDGRISRDEFAAAREKQFDRLDRNHDNVVSRDDFGRLIKFRPQAGERLDRWIAAADGNHDGKVTREELHAAPMPLFDRADTNHDGYVDESELKALRAKIGTARDGGDL